MSIHESAKLTPLGREILVRRITEEGLRVEAAAQASGVSVRTAYKWLARWREEGLPGLGDRSSRPHRCPHRTSEARRTRVVELRRERRTYHDISQQLGISPSTVGRIAQRAGVNRLSQLEPPPPPNRYVYPDPGGLLHLDIEKLGRFRRPGHRATGNRRSTSPRAGWEFVHVCVDDHSRLAFSKILPDESAHSAAAFLTDALAYFQSLAIPVQRLLTDNGGCYRSRAFNARCQQAGIRHLYTRPFTPRTNGKAERFIQTVLREWAYAHTYQSSEPRAAQLPAWLHRYNWHRPHTSLHHRPPIQALDFPLNNLVSLHT